MAFPVHFEMKFPWLYHSQVKCGYMCKYCELFAPSNDPSIPYVTCGAIMNSHPTRRMEVHQESQRHKMSAEKYVNVNMQMNISQTLKQAAQKKATDDISRNRAYMIKLFKTVAFMCERKWAQMNFPDMIKFMGEVCDPVLEEVAKEGVNYLSSTSVSELISLFSEYLERQLLNDLKDEKFTLLADESTDSCNRTQFSIFARWVKEDGMKEHYLGLINVDQTTSLALLEAIQAFCRGKQIQLKNVIFVGLDGCNTMSGKQKGLQRRIRHESPLSVYVNCRNHRLALCFVHLLKENDLLKEVDGVLLSIWKLFNFSPKKEAVFQHMQEVYGERPIKFVRAATARWLSHLRACVRFISRYEILMDTFDSIIESTRDPEVQGIRNSVSRKDVVATILVLADVLRPVNYLSLYLQTDCGTFTELPARVKKCTDDLHDIAVQYQNMTLIGLEFSKCEQMFGVITARNIMARRLRLHQQQDVEPEEFLQTSCIPLIHSLIGEIEDAFSNHATILSAFSLLDPHNLPESPRDIPEYGKNAANELAEFYGSETIDVYEGHRSIAPPELGDKDLILNQLLGFRHQLFIMKRRGADSLMKVYQQLVHDQILQDSFSTLVPLYKLALLIPQSTAVVERGFSMMNDISTSLRTLSQGMLDSLMRINYMSNTMKSDDYESLVDLFKNRKARDMPL